MVKCATSTMVRTPDICTCDICIQLPFSFHGFNLRYALATISGDMSSFGRPLLKTEVTQCTFWSDKCVRTEAVHLCNKPLETRMHALLSMSPVQVDGNSRVRRRPEHLAEPKIYWMHENGAGAYEKRGRGSHLVAQKMRSVLSLGTFSHPR